MARQAGSSITERHILAADQFRLQWDVAALGFSPAKEVVPVNSLTYHPRSGFSAGAVAQVAASAAIARVLRRFTGRQQWMLLVILIFNKSLKQWCDGMDNAAPGIEMGRLLSALDLLEEHYRSAIDRDLARNNVMAT